MALLNKTISFLNSIGIKTQKVYSARGFLNEVRIDKGEILYTDKASISNLLHEAGHLAVLPENYRCKAEDDLSKIQNKMLDENLDIEPDSESMRILLQAGETEATAWAYAAGVAIGLPEEVIIEDKDYDNDGKNIRLCLSMRSYLGINGLRNGGMIFDVKEYPVMARWLQPAI